GGEPLPVSALAAGGAEDEQHRRGAGDSHDDLQDRDVRLRGRQLRRGARVVPPAQVADGGILYGGIFFRGGLSDAGQHNATQDQEGGQPAHQASPHGVVVAVSSPAGKRRRRRLVPRR